MAKPFPTVGMTVLYTLSEQDADQTNKRRDDTFKNLKYHQENSNGVQVHVGNKVTAGEVYPMMIVRIWGNAIDSAVNGQVLLDGNDCLWVTSVSAGTGERHFAFME